MTQNQRAWRDSQSVENTGKCAGNEASQQNGGYNLINSAQEWQQQSWSSLPAAEWRDGMCERSAEMHSSSSSSSTSSSSSSFLPFTSEKWKRAILTLALSTYSSVHHRNSTDWVQSGVDYYIYNWGSSRSRSSTPKYIYKLQITHNICG